MKYLALLAGGIGPDVWDKEIEVDDDDITGALCQCVGRAEEMGGGVFSINQNDWPAWTQTSPSHAGLYWLWQGDEDAAPFPVTVMYSGTSGECFLASGQWGWNRHQDCSELQGSWWMPCTEPALPTSTK